MFLSKNKPDNLGAIASALCLMHCIATPLIFIVQSCSVTTSCCAATPTWWRAIDYLFILISFFAVYNATKTTSNNWIKPSLWLSWSLLVIIILNEELGLLSLHRNLIYFPAITLITLHMYNKFFTQCDNDKCCTDER